MQRAGAKPGFNAHTLAHLSILQVGTASPRGCDAAWSRPRVGSGKPAHPPSFPRYLCQQWDTVSVEGGLRVQAQELEQIEEGCIVWGEDGGYQGRVVKLPCQSCCLRRQHGLLSWHSWVSCLASLVCRFPRVACSRCC